MWTRDVLNCAVACHKSSKSEVWRAARPASWEEPGLPQGSLRGSLEVRGRGALLLFRLTKCCREAARGVGLVVFHLGKSVHLTHHDGEAGRHPPPLITSVLLVWKFLKIKRDGFARGAGGCCCTSNWQNIIERRRSGGECRLPDIGYFSSGHHDSKDANLYVLVILQLVTSALKLRK